MSGNTAANYNVYALILHEREAELEQKDGKLLLRVSFYITLKIKKILLFSDFELETPLEELDKEELNKARNIKKSTYKKYRVMLMKNQIRDFATNYHLNEEIVTVSDLKNLKKKKHYLLFLTKTQIQRKGKAAKNKETFDLKISKTQMKKNW